MSESEDSTKGELIKAGAEVVKTAYDDALQPIARETGKALGTLGRTINVALFPLRGLVWSWEQIESYVSETIERKLNERKVPKERIQTPNPDIAVPALETLRYSKLRENFANLLATSMDTETALDAHPAFVEILKQLTPDEAKLLQYLPPKGKSEPVVNVVFKLPEKGEFILFRNASTLGQDAKCEFPDLTPKYLDNLCRLGLAEIPDGRWLFDDWRYDKIRKSKTVIDALKSAPHDGKTDLTKKLIGITDLGEGFRKACI